MDDMVDDRFLQIAAATRRDASLIPPEVAARVLARRGVLTLYDLRTGDPSAVRSFVSAAATRWIYEPPPPGGLPLWHSKDVVAGWAAYALVAQDDDGLRATLHAAAEPIPAERVERARRLLEIIGTWIDDARAGGASVERLARMLDAVTAGRSVFRARVADGRHGHGKARFASMAVGDLVLVVAQAAVRATAHRPGLPLYGASAVIAGDEQPLAHQWVFDQWARILARQPGWHADPRAAVRRLRQRLRYTSTHRTWRSIGRGYPSSRESVLEHLPGEAAAVPDDAAPWQLAVSLECDRVSWTYIVLEGAQRLVMIGYDREGRPIAVSDDDFVCTPRTAAAAARSHSDQVLVVNDLALPIARSQETLFVLRELPDLGLAAMVAPLLD